MMSHHTRMKYLLGVVVVVVVGAGNMEREHDSGESKLYMHRDLLNLRARHLNHWSGCLNWPESVHLIFCLVGA